jgi:hypothetical protein
VSSYTFARFIDDVEWRVRLLSKRVHDPEFSWPGILILDVGSGLSVEAFPIGATAAEHRQLVAELVNRIRTERARRFAWVMPCFRRDQRGDVECLLVVCGEPNRPAQALVAEIARTPGLAPRLRRFSRGAFGSSARRVSGQFVEPLLEAFDR